MLSITSLPYPSCLEVGFKLNLHIFSKITNPASMETEKAGGRLTSQEILLEDPERRVLPFVKRLLSKLAPVFFSEGPLPAVLPPKAASLSPACVANYLQTHLLP